MSMNILIVVNFLSNKDVISSINLINVKVVDQLYLRPYWLSYKRSFVTKCLNPFANNCSNICENVCNKEICL